MCLLLYVVCCGTGRFFGMECVLIQNEVSIYTRTCLQYRRVAAIVCTTMSLDGICCICARPKKVCRTLLYSTTIPIVQYSTVPSNNSIVIENVNSSCRNCCRALYTATNSVKNNGGSVWKRLLGVTTATWCKEVATPKGRGRDRRRNRLGLQRDFGRQGACDARELPRHLPPCRHVVGSPEP